MSNPIISIPTPESYDALTTATNAAAAQAVAAAGLTPRANLAAITGADGYYRAMDTGNVYHLVSGVATEQPQLEVLSAASIATTTIKGPVLKAAALTAAAVPSTALTVSATYVQAEEQAIIARQEALRARLADLEAKLQAAGILT